MAQSSLNTEQFDPYKNFEYEASMLERGVARDTEFKKWANRSEWREPGGDPTWTRGRSLPCQPVW